MADLSQIANYQVKGRASNDSLLLPDRVLRLVVGNFRHYGAYGIFTLFNCYTVGETLDFTG